MEQTFVGNVLACTRNPYDLGDQAAPGQARQGESLALWLSESFEKAPTMIKVPQKLAALFGSIEADGFGSAIEVTARAFAKPIDARRAVIELVLVSARPADSPLHVVR